MGKTKKDTNARVAGWRKQTKESVVEQMCSDNGSNGSQWVRRFVGIRLNRRVTVKIAVIAVKLPNFYITFLFLDSLFLPAWYDSHSFICKANFRFFTLRFIFIRSLLLSLFRTGPRSFPWSMFTYNLIELHLIRKMLGLKLLINWVEVSSQSIRVIHTGNIPAKVILVDCIRVIGLSIKRELLLLAIT